MNLTYRMQVQAIADLLHNYPLDINPKELNYPFDYFYQLLAEERSSERRQVFDHTRLVMEDNPDLRNILNDISNTKPGYRRTYKPMSERGPELKPISFLWEGWVPIRYLTIITAFPDAGKTTICLDLERRISKGLPAPDGQEFKNIRSGKVLHVDAEDVVEGLWEMAKAWDMATEKWYVYERPDEEDKTVSLIDLNDIYYQEELWEMCLNIKPDLIVVDSMSEINSRGDKSVEDIRMILAYLNKIAKRMNCAVILIHHPRKLAENSIPKPINQFSLRGSGHIVAASRSVLAIDFLNPDKPNGPRLIRQIKGNFNQKPDPLTVHFNNGPGEVAHLSYTSDVRLQPKRTITEDCSMWLIDLLKEQGPLTYTQVMEYAEEEGFKVNVVLEARNLIPAIVDTRGSKRKGNKWAYIEPVEPETLTVNVETFD